MKALTYRITKHTIQGWTPVHLESPRGIAYDAGTHFVHIFGKDKGLWVIDNLAATEAKSGTLRDWIDKTFGAADVENATYEAGHTVKGVWRPGLYHVEETLLISP